MKMLYRISLAISVVVIGLASALASEKAVTLKDLPPAVRRTVQEQSNGATIRGFSKEIEGGKTTYEVEMKVNGHGKDISMDATGAVIEIEEEVALEDVPGAARAAIEKAAGGGQVTMVERVSRGKRTAYEAHFRRNGKRSEVSVSDDGRVLPED